MSDLTIKRVVGRREQKQFLRFPWDLYRDDPNWIPPLRDNQKELVGYQPHPFYERNQVQTFLAFRDGEVCGRIAAILNQGTSTIATNAAGSSASSSASTIRRRPTACSTPSPLVRRPGHPLAARADQPVAELRSRAVDRRVRFAADVHDDLQSRRTTRG